jgi:hypothetical protein
MGGYVDYIKDYPCRILKLYETSLSSAKLNGLEVTFLLSLTTSGIAVPLDRLLPELLPDGNPRLHPDPFEDRNTFKEAAKKFAALYKSCFRESELWDSCFEKWRYGKCRSGNIEPDSCSLKELCLARPTDNFYSVKQVIEHLRHSLAHGVISTDTNKEKEITEINLFTGKRNDGLKVLRVTPQSLEKFLRKWVDWLQTLDVPIWGKCGTPVNYEQ